MIRRTTIFFALTFLLLSCTKVRVELPNDSEWIYSNKEILKIHYPIPNSECQIKISDNIIYVKSDYIKRCEIINSSGVYIDTTMYDTIPFRKKIKIEDSIKTYVWDTWKYDVDFSNKSRVAELSYITKPVESVKLLSRSRPKREHIIAYVLDGKRYSMVLPTSRSTMTIYNICQYSETQFLFSAFLKIEDIEYSGARNYIIMLDLEDLSRRRFLGMKL